MVKLLAFETMAGGGNNGAHGQIFFHYHIKRRRALCRGSLFFFFFPSKPSRLFLENMFAVLLIIQPTGDDFY